MKKKVFTAGDEIATVDGRRGVVVRSLADDLTFPPGSYECDLGHGYLVVRHKSEIGPARGTHETTTQEVSKEEISLKA